MKSSLKYKSNIRMEYLYRDAGNYKFRGDVVFTNLRSLSVSEIESLARECLIDGAWFVTTHPSVPDLRPTDLDYELDHDWHEIHSFSETDAGVNDALDLDIEDFLRWLRVPSNDSTPQFD